MKLFCTFFLTISLFAQASAAPDTLGRDNPRATVTNFLEACRDGDYSKAAQYLDLTSIPAPKRAQRGPELARQLEAVLNSDSDFSVLRISRDPQGSQSNGREHVATLTEHDKPVTLDLQLIAPSPNATPLWLFSSDALVEIPKLAVDEQPSPIARHLPPFFSKIQIWKTPLWKWIGLLLGTLILIAISRQLDRLVMAVTYSLAERFHFKQAVAWVRAIMAPLRVLLCLILFRVGLELIGPSAIARLYVGRVAQALLLASVAWCLMRMVELSIERVESRMDEDRRFASRSILQLTRRSVNVAIGILAILLALSNWGYNTATLVAGLGVGGIAIALAAQQTIANIFGGVSVIADHPIRVGEFGKFGELYGALEDIGLRSTRIRTLNRTVVSVPNSTFAGYNLENFGARDKILFNPTIAIQRSTPEEKIRALLDALYKMLASHKQIEAVPTPARIVGVTGPAINIEIFCYVLTHNLDAFYGIQGDLYLAINQALADAKVELA